MQSLPQLKKTRPRLAAGQASEFLLSTTTQRCGQIKSRGGRRKWEKETLPPATTSFYTETLLSEYGGFILNDVAWHFYRNLTSGSFSQDPMARRLRLVSRHSRSLRMSNEEIPFLASEHQVSRRPRQGREGLKAWCFDRFYVQNRLNWTTAVSLAAVGAIMLLSWIMWVQLILPGHIRN